MKMKNAMQLKALIKNKAKEKNISAQLVMQNYMLERLLERISLSSYKNNFIIKGGFLVSAIVGLDTRTTMDLDTTIKGFNLTHENILRIFENICAIQIDDGIQFELTNILDIREKDDYPGVRIMLKAHYSPISVSISVDITTGDMITPHEIEYAFPMLFKEGYIKVLSYNLETILAEKLETVLSRNIANTRLRDYYDIYVLYNLYNAELNLNVLSQSLIRTLRKRGSLMILDEYPKIMMEIRKSLNLQNQWRKYRDFYDYAKDISFDDICNTIVLIMDAISCLIIK